MKIQLYLLLGLYLLGYGYGLGQQKTIFKNGIDSPYMLSTHHFGIFNTRIAPNFKVQPTKKSSLEISMASGNVFHPSVEAYLPEDPVVRQALSKVTWYNRKFDFIDQNTTPATHMHLHADAVLKNIRIAYTIRLHQKHELGIAIRSYLISSGKNSLLTSDRFIEWFHSNIAGGEDPFGRKHYGFNKAEIAYKDRNGNTMELQKGDFILGGIAVNHHYYPSFGFLKKRNIQLNTGVHLGINTSRYNASIDLGLSLNTVKTWELTNKNTISFGLGVQSLRKNSIALQKQNMDFGNTSFLNGLDGMVAYRFSVKKSRYHSFGVHYKIQSAYNNRQEKSYYKLLGNWQDIHSGWANGITTLYTNTSAWSFIYTYGFNKHRVSLYLQQDFQVHNAPDFQTGIAFKTLLF